jgi:Circularly permutated YpsA SLOG family
MRLAFGEKMIVTMSLAVVEPVGAIGFMTLVKIVSGGQTGVDRGALDAALVAGFACGGWCPSDRGAEDGVIPDRYPLTLLPPASASVASEDMSARQVAEQYRARTLKNVQDSDGTVILFSGTLSGGTLLTQKLCVREKKPFIAVDAKVMTKLRAAVAVGHFIEENQIQVLNVAGPRLSGWPQGYTFALGVIGAVISNL